MWADSDKAYVFFAKAWACFSFSALLKISDCRARFIYQSFEFSFPSLNSSPGSLKQTTAISEGSELPFQPFMSTPNIKMTPAFPAIRNMWMPV